MRGMVKALAGATLGLAAAAGVLPAGPAGAAGAHTAPAADDDRAPAQVTVETPDYDFELILHEYLGYVGGYVRRTDDLDNTVDGDRPDRYGFAQYTGWDAVGGRRCVTSGGGEFAYFSDGAPAHAFTYGLAGRQVARVRVTLDDGRHVDARTSRATVDGFRGWMVERPLGTVAQVEGFDGHGRRVASAAPELPSMTDYAQASTCEVARG